MLLSINDRKHSCLEQGTRHCGPEVGSAEAEPFKKYNTLLERHSRLRRPVAMYFSKSAAQRFRESQSTSQIKHSPSHLDLVLSEQTNHLRRACAATKHVTRKHPLVSIYCLGLLPCLGPIRCRPWACRPARRLPSRNARRSRVSLERSPEHPKVSKILLKTGTSER